jgi:hypothetical protein
MGARVLLVVARPEVPEELAVKEAEEQPEEQVALQIPANKIMGWQGLPAQEEMEVVDQVVVPGATSVQGTMLA